MPAEHFGGGAPHERVGVAQPALRQLGKWLGEISARSTSAFRLCTRSSRSGSPAQASSVASSSAS